MPLRHRMQQLHASWRSAQTNVRRAQYSLERLCALKMYNESKTMRHVLFVCFVSIAVPLLTILALDIVPLQAPTDGWDKNYSLWYRVFVGAFLLAIGVSLQLQAMAPAVALTTRKSVCIGFFTACGNLVYSVALAKLWVFPIPFMTAVSLPSWLSCFFVSVVLMIGVRNLQHNAAVKAQVWRFVYRLNFESTFLFIYPVYNVVFLSLAGWNQFAVIFVLPVVKIVLKRAMKRIVGDLEDLVPVVIISVDLFNALYQSKCMQSSGSLWTTAGIIVIDVIQNVFALHRLFALMSEVQRLTTTEIKSQGLFLYALQLVEQPNQLEPDSFLLLRVRSCTNIYLPRDKAEVIRKATLAQIELMRNVSRTNLPSLSLRRHSMSSVASNPGPRKLSFVLNAIVPLPQLVVVASAPASIASLAQTAKITPLNPGTASRHQPRMSSKDKAMLLKKTVELAWRCELLLLVEYIESAIPLLYAAYLSILHKLPNAKYYPGITDITPERLDQIITSILVYGALELLSLVYVHMVLKWKFKMSALHQLAFALENECLLIQGMFMGWVIVLLQFTLVHFGVDFTFQFAWMART